MREQSAIDRLPGAIAAAENLPSPPTVALEILRVAKDDNGTIEELAAILSRDPVLSAKVLKLANSALFRRGDVVSSLDTATMRLGMKTVKLMALSFSLSGELPRKREEGGFDYAAYWSRSVTMAVAGRALARLVRSGRGDEAFLCGLLGRIGQLVMARCIPDEYGVLIAEADGDLPTACAEREALGYDSLEIGSSLLQSWDLPDLIWQGVRHWDDPTQVPAELEASLQALARLLHLADLTTTVICDPHRKASALHRLHERGRDFCGLSEDEIDAFIVSLERDVADMAALLDMQVDHDCYQGIVERARMEMVQLSLGTALDLQATSSRAEELERENEQLASLASTDQLTGLANRAHFDHSLEKIVRARLAGQSENALGILMVDVDHFKKFNDTHGHQVGDEVLKLVADCLKAATRETDVVARYGGEEFVTIVPNTTLEMLERVAERMRARIADTPLVRDGDPLAVTASVGGACVARIGHIEDGVRLLTLADECLYEAKRSGRNRVVCREVEIPS